MYPTVQREMCTSPDTGERPRFLNALCRERCVPDSNCTGQPGALLEDRDMQNCAKLKPCRVPGY